MDPPECVAVGPVPRGGIRRHSDHWWAPKLPEGENARFQLAGELTLRGITLPTVWDLSARLRDGKISGRVETRLRMTDLGFDPPNFANTLTVANEFTVRIDFVAKEQ